MKIPNEVSTVLNEISTILLIIVGVLVALYFGYLIKHERDYKNEKKIHKA